MSETLPNRFDILSSIKNHQLEKAQKQLAKLVVAQEQFMHALLLAEPGKGMVTMNALLDRGFDVNAQFDEEGYTPLHLACEMQNRGAIEMLLARGANPGLLNAKGKYPHDYLKSRNLMKILHKGHLDWEAGEDDRRKAWASSAVKALSRRNTPEAKAEFSTRLADAISGAALKRPRRLLEAKLKMNP
ncbi:MAG TPA: hypothetical protein DCW68_01550 [Rhodospirillaceae bacterium]|nr:MAG: hypothetical protein A2018_04515 [Alphaproteobacteria bacterium GWF2_58_20]HAU28783.1 hypothetical protein [Rhodospirillaceae bacterium]